jgi:hypothetical protein
LQFFYLSFVLFHLFAAWLGRPFRKGFLFAAGAGQGVAFGGRGTVAFRQSLDGGGLVL